MDGLKEEKKWRRTGKDNGWKARREEGRQVGRGKGRFKD
jgi:hypothetical protein